MPPTAHVTLGGIPSGEAFGTPTVTAWFAETLAPKWIEDALATHSSQPEADARRKEVIFAVAAAESYLIEWARDEVFKGDLPACRAYLLAKEQQSVLVRWKQMTNDFADARLIASAPDFGRSCWQCFGTLVRTRNNLMHGNYSRPLHAEDRSSTGNFLRPDELWKKEPGWAVGIVCNLVLELSAAAQTAPPNWAVANAPKRP